MKFRITCRADQVPAVKTGIRQAFNVTSISRWHPNTREPGSDLGRIYVEAETAATDRVLSPGKDPL